MTDRDQLRLQRINGKGLEVAQKLSALMAGKNVTLAEIDDPTRGRIDDERLTKEERLRSWLDAINDARRRLQAGDGFGECRACGEPIVDAVLDETPWVQRCRACEEAGRPLR